MKRMIIALIIIIALPLAVFYVDKSFSKRGPASDESSLEVTEAADHDLSAASPAEFIKAFKYQVLKEVSLQKLESGPGLQLGSFLLKNAQGNKVFVCDEYPTIDLIFAAEGVAYSGEIPKLIVRGPCLITADQKHIAALPIPFNKIFGSPITQFEFKADIPDSREQVSVYANQVRDSWPTEWNWIGMKFYGKDPQKQLSITGYEVISVLGQPLTLSPESNE